MARPSLRLVLALGGIAAAVVVAAVLTGGGSETGAISGPFADAAEVNSAGFEVTELAEIDQLRQAFDAAEGRPRLVLLVDPI